MKSVERYFLLLMDAIPLPEAAECLTGSQLAQRMSFRNVGMHHTKKMSSGSDPTSPINWKAPPIAHEQTSLFVVVVVVVGVPCRHRSLS